MAKLSISLVLLSLFAATAVRACGDDHSHDHSHEPVHPGGPDDGDGA